MKIHKADKKLPGVTVSQCDLKTVSPPTGGIDVFEDKQSLKASVFRRVSCVILSRILIEFP